MRAVLAAAVFAAGLSACAGTPEAPRWRWTTVTDVAGGFPVRVLAAACLSDSGAEPRWVAVSDMETGTTFTIFAFPCRDEGLLRERT